MKLQIKSLGTSDGYLKGVSIDFAPGLTCIIGARGTCKSTIVETLRFAHDLDPSRIEILLDTADPRSPAQGPRGLLRETLAEGTAVCTLERVDERGGAAQLRLERSIDAERPRLVRDGIVDLEPWPAGVPIEIYSQGELLSIAEDPERRLRLVDRPHAPKLAEIRSRLTAQHRRIESLGARILALRAGLREDEQALAPLPELEARLQTLTQERPILDAHLEKEREGFEARAQLLAQARSSHESFAALLSAPFPTPPDERMILGLRDALVATGIPEAQPVAEQLQQLTDAAVLLSRRLSESRQLLARAAASLRDLEAAFEAHNQRYRTLRREQEALSASLEQEDRLRAQRRQLLQRRDERDRRQAELRVALAQRKQARRAAEECLDEIFALRLREIDRVGIDLGKEIALQIVQGAQSGAYVDAIAELLQGTRLKRQREIATKIADLLMPSELVDIVEQERSEHLARIANLEPSQASRIINHFVDHMPRVLALEAIVFDDQLDITMNVDGEVRPIEQLSRGQMATALLPLVLRPGDVPLVFDQPEDDLDNRFIFDHLVARIRRLKRHRQLVFVTHNANIPVLGDADRVVVMSMAGAREAAPPVAGTVDEMSRPILDILEGGAVAFEERRKRYAGIAGPERRHDAGR